MILPSILNVPSQLTTPGSPGMNSIRLGRISVGNGFYLFSADIVSFIVWLFFVFFFKGAFSSTQTPQTVEAEDATDYYLDDDYWIVCHQKNENYFGEKNTEIFTRYF